MSLNSTPNPEMNPEANLETNPDSLNRLSALAAARLIARRELSCEQLVRACLARIQQREAVVGAWTQLDPEKVLEEARVLDSGALRGPLHGLPLGVKDLIDTRQYATAYGSPIYSGHRPAWDAACVARARAAGALVLGKTVTTEFATYHAGKTANPHHPGCTPGGSSSGSAAAVADFMVPLAYGSQTAGSVIRPAAFCGVVGYKPSYGLICRAGVKSLSESLDTLGVLAREVGDAAFFAGVLAGRDLLPALGAAAPRVGLCRTHEWAQASVKTQQLLEAAAAALAVAGAKVVDITLPDEFTALTQTQSEIMAYEAAQALAFEVESCADQLSPKLRELIAQGRAVSPARHDDNLQRAARCRRQLADLFREVDVLLSPSTIGEAPEGLAATGDPLFNRMWTLLGTPCIHLPCAHGPQGLPLGVQAIGASGADRALLSAADWMHRVLLAAAL
jgi:Asp-tRNA(Asn)/Glu-tRNA(Gln) amidotransferase A subunit family amidase